MSRCSGCPASRLSPYYICQLLRHLAENTFAAFSAFCKTFFLFFHVITMVSTESATRKDFDADHTNKTPSKDRKAAAAAGGSSPPGSSSSTIAPYYQKVLAKYPVLLRHTKAKGRHAAASRNLDQGVTVCQEQATAFVVRSEYIDQQCHVCLESLAAAKRAMMCQDCKKAFYCSNACLERDTGVHRLICTALAQVDAIGRATDVDPDLLRLILLLLARRQLEMDQDAMLEGTPFWCVNDLVSHRDRANPAFVAVVKDAGNDTTHTHVAIYIVTNDGCS